MNKHTPISKGDRDMLIVRVPKWMGRMIRDDALEQGDIGYANVVVDHLLPIYQERYQQEQQRAVELPMTG